MAQGPAGVSDKSDQLTDVGDSGHVAGKQASSRRQKRQQALDIEPGTPGPIPLAPRRHVSVDASRFEFRQVPLVAVSGVREHRLRLRVEGLLHLVEQPRQRALTGSVKLLKRLVLGFPVGALVRLPALGVAVLA